MLKEAPPIVHIASRYYSLCNIISHLVRNSVIHGKATEIEIRIKERSRETFHPFQKNEEYLLEGNNPRNAHDDHTFPINNNTLKDFFKNNTINENNPNFTFLEEQFLEEQYLEEFNHGAIYNSNISNSQINSNNFIDSNSFINHQQKDDILKRFDITVEDNGIGMPPDFKEYFLSLEGKSFIDSSTSLLDICLLGKEMIISSRIEIQNENNIIDESTLDISEELDSDKEYQWRLSDNLNINKELHNTLDPLNTYFENESNFQNNSNSLIIDNVSIKYEQSNNNVYLPQMYESNLGKELNSNTTLMYKSFSNRLYNRDNNRFKCRSFLGGNLKKGTSITLRDIFSTFPVRLRTLVLNSEISHLIRFLSILSMIHNKVRFHLFINDELKFRSEYSLNLDLISTNTISNYFGFDRASKLKKISLNNLNFNVIGYLSNPYLNYTGIHITNMYRILFINGIPVSSPFIENLINDRYKKIIATKRRMKSNKFFGNNIPMYILSLQLNESDFSFLKSGHDYLLDVAFVNIDTIESIIEYILKTFFNDLDGVTINSPSKSNINYDHRILNVVKKISSRHSEPIRRSTNGRNIYLSPKISDSPVKLSKRIKSPHKSPSFINKGKSNKENYININTQGIANSYISKKMKDIEIEPPIFSSFELNQIENKPSDNELNSLNIIAQWDNKFIIAKNKEKILIFDQHACDERIRFEFFLNDIFSLPFAARFRKDTHQANKIICEKPRFFSVPSPLYVDTMIKYQKEIEERWWWKYELIEHQKFTLLEYPKIENRNLNEKFLIRFIDECNSSFSGSIPLQGIPKIFMEIIQSISCRSAVMFGDPIPKETCVSIISALQECRNPFECCHGRPSFVNLIKYTSDDPEKLMYKRDKLKSFYNLMDLEFKVSK